MKYEYHSTAIHGTDLQAKGQEGWHLVGVNHENMFWQRPVYETTDAPGYSPHPQSRDWGRAVLTDRDGVVVEPEVSVTAEAEPATVETEPAPIAQHRGRRPKVRV